MNIQKIKDLRDELSANYRAAAGADKSAFFHAVVQLNDLIRELQQN